MCAFNVTCRKMFIGVKGEILAVGGICLWCPPPLCALEHRKPACLFVPLLKINFCVNHHPSFKSHTTNQPHSPTTTNPTTQFAHSNSHHTYTWLVKIKKKTSARVFFSKQKTNKQKNNRLLFQKSLIVGIYKTWLVEENISWCYTFTLDFYNLHSKRSYLSS